MLADIIVYSTLLVVWDYVASAAKSTSRATWAGHPARFVVLALGLSMVFGGCAGVAASRLWPEFADKLGWVPTMLCTGILLYVLANRRNCLYAHKTREEKANPQ